MAIEFNHLTFINNTDFISMTNGIIRWWATLMSVRPTDDDAYFS